MYRLFVADDEQIVLDSIKFIVDANFTNIDLVGTARSGREAIEKIEYLRPDMVFMDIKMPGINGIEAIDEIKSKFIGAKYIIISAYEEFDLAKKVLSMGVVEYILKPITKKKIIDIINRVITLIEDERNKRNKELELKEKFENVMPVIENSFIYSLLLFDEDKNIISPYIEILNLKNSGCSVITIEFGSEDRLEVLNSSISNEKVCPHLREEIKKSKKSIVGPLMSNRVIVILLSEENDNEYSKRVDIIKFSQNIINKLSKITSEKINIGIGNYYSNIFEAKNSYRESIISLKHAGENEAVHINDILEHSNNKIYSLDNIENRIIEKIQFGNVKEGILLYNEIFEELVSEYNSDVTNIKMRLLEVMVMINRLALDNKIYDELNHNYISEILKLEKLSDLKVYCFEKIKYITKEVKKSKEKRFSNIIKKSIEYINDNFISDINLYDIAKYTSLSPHYFSKLFKDETKENFIDYLTRVRIEKAKELLKSGKMSVKEICYFVGYKDPNYFSRIFKKHVGISPSDFKDRE